MLLASVWSLAVVIVTGLALIVFFARASTARFDDSLSELVDNLVAGTSLDDAGQVAAPPLTDQRALRAYSGKYWEIAQVTDVGGFKAVVRSRSLWDQEIAPPPEGVKLVTGSPGKAAFYDSHGPQKGEHVRVAAMQALLPDMKSPLIFIAAEDRSPIDRDLRTFAASVALALALLGAGLVTAVVIQVRFGLEPLFALRREVAAVRTGKAERVAGSYPTELEPLAHELNALVAHNQEVVERQRTHVGNLAHALKTPLSVMLAEASAQPGSLAEVVTRQSETMRQQVDHHLRRARAAARAAHGLGERTPVGEVIDELAVMLERVFQSKDVEIDWRAPDELGFLGERQDLQEILGNLIENACKWCRRRVRVSAGPSGLGQMIVVVEDDGPGLPVEQRETAMKRGQRMDEDAPGSGLGLSIVDDLTRAYGGRLTLSASDMGGLKAILELPAAEA